MKLTVGEEEAGQRLDRFIAGRFPQVSRSVVMKYLKEGNARLNRARARPGLFVRAGDTLEMPAFDAAVERIRGGRAAGLPELVKRARPQGILVLYEDEQMVAVDKPAGLVMHPGKGHEEEGLDRILREQFGPSTRLVHRIDRDTSGVVVAARGHPESARRLAEAFKKGDAEKVYLALVRGVPEPPSGTVDEPLIDTRQEGSRVYVDPHGKTARTDYETLEAFEGYAWLRVEPKTGRRHQIRAHLAHIRHPLAVDHVYSRCKRLKLRDLRPDLSVTWQNPVILTRQPLHASEIRLRHPRSGEEVTLRAPLPEDLEQALGLLASDAS
ncbi:MAG: RluA family pseudouridine synthase [Planctomycetota bacterium]|jgi:23S rRNA pseudouridine1911/1915/1917 synthase